jgi:hypothetical protein
MQRLNTALLLVVTVLLMILLLRPHAGRYQYMGDDLFPYVLDTATSEMTVVSATEEARARYKKREEEKKAEQEAAHQEWLAANCPDILAGRDPFPNSSFPQHRRDDRRRECQEWQQAQRSASE